MIDAQLDDLFVDDQDRIWRCVGVINEPSVIMEELEGHTQAPPDYHAMATMQARPPDPPPIIKERKNGGVSASMWTGFRRIWRKL